MCSFDYADPTYGTTPYAQESLVENNVIWRNGGRGIEASGAQPTSHVTIRNNTLFDDVTRQQQYGGSEIVRWGNGNTLANNLVYTLKTRAPLSSSNCVTTPSSYTTIPVASNLMGVDPGLAAETSSTALTVQDFSLGAGSKAAHAGTSTDFAPFDYAYVTGPAPPSIGAFEP